MSNPRRMLARVLAAALSAALLTPVLPAAPASAETVLTTDPAEAGAGWLMRQFADRGYLAGFSGTPDYTVTADAVLALVAVGTGRTQVERALTFLAGGVDGDYAQDANGADLPGRLGKLLMAAEAAGANGRAFGGRDLVAAIQGTLETGGADAGRYTQPEDPNTQGSENGASKQAFAILGLAAAGVAPHASAVQWLLGQQCPDGSWQAFQRDAAADGTRAACTSSDTNSTSYAIMALVAADELGLTVDPAAITRALGYLDSTQRSDGGIPYSPVGFNGQPAMSDSNSTALALQALSALGEDPTAGRWVESGGDVVDALFGLQAGCEHDDAAGRGGWFYDGGEFSTDPDAFATVQAVVAAVGEFLPIAPVASTAELATVEPVLDCAGLAATAISITSNVRTITFGNRPTLSGRATDAQNAGVNGAVVTVYGKAYGSDDYVEVGTARTSSTGAWSLTVAPQKQTGYVAVVGRQESAEHVVFVSQRMTITSPSHNQSLPSRTAVTGSVVPGGTGTPVGVAAVIGGRYRFLASGRTTGTGFSIPVTLPRGTYALVVYTSARNGLLKGSRSVQVTVR